MRYFKLNCLSISVNNRIVRKEDEEILKETDLGDSLVNQYLKEEKIIETDSKGNPKKGGKKEAPNEPEKNPAFEDGVKEMGDLKLDQIKEFLDEAEIEYSSDENKPELYQKYVKSKEGVSSEEINQGSQGNEDQE